VVVDVQGVSEIYTDPQVHSRAQKGYGEGDLGSRGHALFLRTFRHELNPVVQRMGLQRFAMLEGELGPAPEAEVQAFQQGRLYLEGEAWARREALAAAAATRRSLSSGSAGSLATEDNDEARAIGAESRGDAHAEPGCGTEREVEPEAFGDVEAAEEVDDSLPDLSALPKSAPPLSEINAVPDLLLEYAATVTPGTCPSAPGRQRVPARETAEAAAHAALADLYDLLDERVCGELAAPRPAGAAPAPSAQQCSRFHRWMAALAGSPVAMMAMANVATDAHWPCSDADRLGWAHMASLRGSRAGGILAFQLADPRDRLLRIAHLQRAVESEDGKSERERKEDLETCQHELLALLAAEFLALGESGSAIDCLTKAAERALEAGDFKISAKYQQQAEEAADTDGN
jgi:hypothetical protein